jgi:hypothetical protein
MLRSLLLSFHELRGVAQLVEQPSPNERLKDVSLFLLRKCSITEAMVIKARPHQIPKG